MKLELTEEQEMLRSTIREFADKEIAPRAAEIDQTAEFPFDNVKKCAELNLMGVSVPEEYGGGGMDTVSYCIVIEEISRVCGSTGVILSVNNSLVCDPIMDFGTEEQKKKYLTPLAKGEKIGCHALTEPGAGSDAANQQTKAVKDGNDWVLNGTKVFITNGNAADIILVFARTDPEKKSKGITAFIVEKENPGFSVAKVEDKLGIRASGSSELVFEDCRVPDANRLGEEGQGFKVAMHTLDGGRIGIAAQAVGIAQGAFETALNYSKERVQFGKPISSFQAIQFTLADMATEIDAARLLTYRAAWIRDSSERWTEAASMAKLFASETAMKVATKAVQVLGGYGYVRDYPVERFFRDAKITEIYEGTSEVQRMVIAHSRLKG